MSRALRIKEPIWSIRAVGIATRHLQGSGNVRVQILYKDRFKNRVFPDTLEIAKVRARSYPRKKVRNNTWVRLVSIDDMHPVR